mmetsp:Transcript_7419/g.18638  ORF Transcript_7419/g.18638 Transcript_7419/m.18638 type:complete len:220 (+) Transcript_7419:72-731(+)
MHLAAFQARSASVLLTRGARFRETSMHLYDSSRRDPGHKQWAPLTRITGYESFDVTRLYLYKEVTNKLRKSRQGNCLRCTSLRAGAQASKACEGPTASGRVKHHSRGGTSPSLRERHCCLVLVQALESSGNVEAEGHNSAQSDTICFELRVKPVWNGFDPCEKVMFAESRGAAQSCLSKTSKNWLPIMRARPLPGQLRFILPFATLLLSAISPKPTDHL